VRFTDVVAFYRSPRRAAALCGEIEHEITKSADRLSARLHSDLFRIATETRQIDDTVP
jgi:hypothetical protein